MKIKKRWLAALLLFILPMVRAQTLPTAPIYTYSAVGGYATNGNLTNYTDSVTGTWAMQYDSLNRVQSTAASAGTYQGLTLSWGYDSFGNRLNQTPSGTSNVPVPAAVSATYNINNQMQSSSIPGVGPQSYDAAGNLIFDGINKMAYDAENRLCATYNTIGGTITQYIYDADGSRVAKVNATSLNGNALTCAVGAAGPVEATYLLGQSGEQVTQLDGSGNWQHTNVYAAGQLLATYDQDGSQQLLHFNIGNPLGTKRVQASAGGVAELTCLSLPFGDSLNCTGAAQDATAHHFTGKERDTESGLDYFGARYLSSNMGRWTSPDLPFADQNPENPQSWNLYSYVRNNPLNSIDTNGRVTWLIGGTWYNHKNDDWTPSGPLGQEMSGFFDPNDDDVEQIPWSGGNTAGARAELSAHIAAAMANHAWKPGEQNNIVCHSHGCNGVMGALPSLMADGFFVNNLVSLGQPMRGDYRFTSGAVDSWWNVYARNDMVQKLGGRVPFFGGRTNSNATNIQVNTGKNPIGAHGALHNDWLTRMQWEMLIRSSQQSDPPIKNKCFPVTPGGVNPP